jgi:site-specific DNA-cytosine methylase
MVGGLLSYPITHILSPDKPAPTLTATDSSRMVIVAGEGLRRFRRKELKNLFGFKPSKLDLTGVPDDKVFDLLGNTVIPPVAEAAMLALLDTTQP